MQATLIDLIEKIFISYKMVDNQRSHNISNKFSKTRDTWNTVISELDPKRYIKSQDIDTELHERRQDDKVQPSPQESFLGQR